MRPRRSVGVPVGVPVRATGRIAIMVVIHGTVQVTIATGLLHLPVGFAPDGRVVRLETGAGVARANGGEEVDVEREDVKGEDEGDDPLEHGGGVGGLCEVAGCEGDGEDHLDDDKDELDPEGDAQDSVRAEV